MEEKLTVQQTARGFDRINFTDQYGVACSLQKSSLAFEDCIWLGCNEPDPKIMAWQAAAHGVQTSETTGWVPFPLPDEVLCNTRMHLSREQVAELLPYLQRFVETGELSGEAQCPND